MKKILSLLVLVLSLSTISRAQTDEAYREALSKFYRLSGSEQTVEVAIRRILKINKTQYSQVPAGVWNELEGDFLKTSVDASRVGMGPKKAA